MNLAKFVALLKRPAFVGAVLRHGTAAAVEHTDAIAWSRARTLLDIGANKGQFSLAFRSLKPGARIIAFEPLPEAADRFTRVFHGDERVSLHRLALAEANGRKQFHVADRQDSSSLLAPGQGQHQAYKVGPSALIEVEVRRLDQVIDPADLAGPVMMKIDVQGGELAVLKGCSFLDRIEEIYVELSFVELYDGQPLIDEVYGYLIEQGFRLRGTFNQSVTRQFGATQVDCLFVRAEREA